MVEELCHHCGAVMRGEGCLCALANLDAAKASAAGKAALEHIGRSHAADAAQRFRGNFTKPVERYHIEVHKMFGKELRRLRRKINALILISLVWSVILLAGISIGYFLAGRSL